MPKAMVKPQIVSKEELFKSEMAYIFEKYGVTMYTTCTNRILFTDNDRSVYFSLPGVVDNHDFLIDSEDE